MPDAAAAPRDGPPRFTPEMAARGRNIIGNTVVREAAGPVVAGFETPALRAVRQLLAAERAHAARTLPPTDRDWRFLLALYEADLDGRALTPEQAAEAAAVPPAEAVAIAQNFVAQGFLARAPGSVLQLTEEVCDHLAIWVAALRPLVTRPATAAAPLPELPPEPLG